MNVKFLALQRFKLIKKDLNHIQSSKNLKIEFKLESNHGD